VNAFVAAALAALLHITPTVILVKTPDVVRRLAPGADAFFEREVHLSDPDAHKLHEAVDWSPADDVLKFYSAKHGTTLVSVMEFVRVDTPHGPVEVDVGFSTEGKISGVVISKATVETKPWVEEAIAAGLTEAYVGLAPAGRPAGADAIAAKSGDLPHYMAQEVDKGVARALAAYGDFYRAE